MRHQNTPITSIESALTFLANRKGSISFHGGSGHFNTGLIANVQITGEDHKPLQMEWAHSQIELQNERRHVWTNTLVALAEALRIEDCRDPTLILRPDVSHDSQEEKET